MAAAGAVAGVGKGAEGVEPGVDLDPPGVGLLDGVVERVVAGRLAHGAGQPGAPGFFGRLVDRVAMRPHLEDQRVHVERGHLVEDRAHFRLLLRRRQAFRARPVDVVHHGGPGRAELARRPRRLLAGRPVGLGGGKGGKQAGQREDPGEHGFLDALMVGEMQAAMNQIEEAPHQASPSWARTFDAVTKEVG